MRVSGRMAQGGSRAYRPRQPRHVRAIARPREAVVMSAVGGDVGGGCDIAAAGDGRKDWRLRATATSDRCPLELAMLARYSVPSAPVPGPSAWPIALDSCPRVSSLQR